MLRILKILLVLFIGLHALVYALQNLANLEQAHAALGYVLSNQGHEAYPSSMFFVVTNPLLHWCALWLVIFGEFAVGYFGVKGAWDMFAVRKDTADAFVLTRLGFTDEAIYAASLEECAANPDNPMKVDLENIG
jgi:predicted small integral membrane protein